jgi:lipid-A-disaccharide synthase
VTERIVIVAGETSGDNLAAGLIRSLRARRPELQFEGVAGPAMVAEGCQAWAHSEALAVMGLFEVIPHLARMVRLRREVVRRSLACAPRLFIGVDAPSFNLGLAAQLHARGIPTVQYVSPQVWAWRQGRVRSMARTLDLVLCLLPFEKPFYEGRGLAAEFVGHPLADRLPVIADRAAARRALDLPAQGEVVAILPGSRRGEVTRLARDFIGAAKRLAAQRPGIRFVAPMANAAARAIFAATLAEIGGVTIDLVDGRSSQVLTAADCVLVASGTATLETMLCKRPMVVAYRLGAATAWIIQRLMRAPFFSQPNLLAGRAVVPELFQKAVTPEALAEAVSRWLDDPALRTETENTFTRLHEQLRQGASDRAAEAVLALLDRSAGQ